MFVLMYVICVFVCVHNHLYFFVCEGVCLCVICSFFPLMLIVYSLYSLYVHFFNYLVNKLEIRGYTYIQLNIKILPLLVYLKSAIDKIAKLLFLQLFLLHFIYFEIAVK